MPPLCSSCRTYTLRLLFSSLISVHAPVGRTTRAFATTSNLKAQHWQGRGSGKHVAKIEKKALKKLNAVLRDPTDDNKGKSKGKSKGKAKPSSSVDSAAEDEPTTDWLGNSRERAGVSQATVDWYNLRTRQEVRQQKAEAARKRKVQLNFLKDEQQRKMSRLRATSYTIDKGVDPRSKKLDPWRQAILNQYTLWKTNEDGRMAGLSAKERRKKTDEVRLEKKKAAAQALKVRMEKKIQKYEARKREKELALMEVMEEAKIKNDSRGVDVNEERKRITRAYVEKRDSMQRQYEEQVDQLKADNSASEFNLETASEEELDQIINSQMGNFNKHMINFRRIASPYTQGNSRPAFARSMHTSGVGSQQRRSIHGATTTTFITPVANKKPKKPRTTRHKDASIRLPEPSNRKPEANKAEEEKEQEPWRIQKQALKQKFGEEGWKPRKRLSPDAMEGIRALHGQDPDKFSTPVLAQYFEVSPEAIRRILRSKWRPSDEEAEERKQRWEKRGKEIWENLVELGAKPPKKWREMGVGRAEKGEMPRWKDNKTKRGLRINESVASRVDWREQDPRRVARTFGRAGLGDRIG